MSIHHRLSRRHDQRALDAAGPVLDALRAPATASELRREDAAVAAFHTARLTPTPTTRSDMSTPRSAATRAAIATGVVVALSTGGFALAATDHLPTLPDQASDQATESVAKNRATTSPTTTASTTPSDPEPEATKTKKPKKTKTPKPASTNSPSPNLAGLCNAFQNHKKLDGKYLDSAAFTALEAAATAAGAESVTTYCIALIGEPTVKPTKAPKPTKEAKPTKAPKTKKPKPTQAAQPTKPAKPAKPTKPAKPAKPTKAPKV